MVTETTLIHDEDCERMVLGTLLTSSRSIEAAREHLSTDCFFNVTHQEIFSAIMAVDSAGDEVNYVNVNAALGKAGAKAGLPEIIDLQQVFTVGAIDTYVLRLKELDMRRKLWELGQILVRSGTTETDDPADVQEDARRRLTQIFASSSTDVHTLGESFAALKHQIMLNQVENRPIYGTPTGFREIDRRGGLSPTDLVVVAGETSMGKTAFVTALAMSAIKHGHPIAFYSMEMTNMQLAARIVAMQSGINSRAILQEKLTDDKINAVNQSMAAMPADICYFDDDATSSFDKIAASIRTLYLKHGIKGAVVDYLQILNVNMRSANKEQAMGDAARRLKNLAKELGIWIIALSQLNRDRDRNQPSLDRLRDSGQIGEAADTIMLIYRPSLKSGSSRYPEPHSHISTQGTALIDVAKGRNSGIYSFVCGFNADTTCFYDLDPLSLPRRNDQTSAPAEDESFEPPF